MVRAEWGRATSARDSACSFALIVALALAAAACGGADARVAPTSTVRDSAGIHIAESTAPLWAEGERWRLAAEPALEIGMADGPAHYLLSQVRDVRRLDDGSILLVNGASAELRLYAADGAFVRAVGGEGEGPGEFRSPDWVNVIAGDSLLVYDRQLRRLSLMSPDLGFVRSVNLPGTPQSGFPRAIGAFTDGTILVGIEQAPEGPSRPGVRRNPIAYVRLSPTAELLDTLAVMPGEEMMTTDTEAFILFMPVLFGRSTMAASHGGRAYLGSNDSYEIRAHGRDGRLESIVRRLGEPQPVPPGAREERMRAMSEGEDERLGGMLEEAFGQMPAPETLPAYASFLPDDAGNLWVQAMRPTEDSPYVWTVFDAEGRLLGTIELPPRFAPRHIGSDFVLGVVRDELDVERVQLYPLEKPQ